MRRINLCLICCVAAFGVLVQEASATSYVVSPTGGGTKCTEEKPCSLSEGIARSEVGTGNEVLLLGGTYASEATLTIAHPIRFGGKPGTAPLIEETGAGEVYVTQTADATLHDLRVSTGGGFLLQSGAVERLFVERKGGPEACDVSVAPGQQVVVSDTVCWARSGASTSAMFADAVKGSGTIVLRNDTLVAAGKSAEGLYLVSENYGSASVATQLTIAATNVIASGPQEDVLLSTQGNPGYPHSLTATFSHSNYAKFDAGLPETALLDGGGNQTALPLFADAATGDFHEAAASPTLAAGLSDAANGTLALGGEARTSPGCNGALGATDIGAYQVSVTPNCPPPAVPKPSNRIKLGKLRLNRKAGTATLIVTLPDPGKLTVSGRGARKVTRAAKKGGNVRISIRATGKAHKRLFAKGRVKLRLNLRFLPTGGSAGTATRKLTLVKAGVTAGH
jgi:hypothetical protein